VKISESLSHKLDLSEINKRPIKTLFFESKFNWDIEFDETITTDHYKYHWITFCDIIPLLGDEYPNIIKKIEEKIKLTIKDKVNCYTYRSFCLIIGNFNSSITTKSQLKQIFKTHKITIVFVDEIIEQNTTNNKKETIKK